MNELPAEATLDGKILANFGVKSNAFVPMQSERTILGSLSFVTVAEERIWPERLIHQLPTVGTIFANALVRKSTDEARVSSELLKRAVLNSLSSGVAVLDGHGIIVSLNPQWTEFVKDSGAGFTAELGVGVNYLEACRAATQAGNQSANQGLLGIEAVLAGEKAQFSTEWDWSGESGPRYTLMTVTPLNSVQAGCVVTHTDITQRKQEERERLALSGQLIHAQEEERSRLARELHDDFNQRLAMFAFDLERVSQMIPDSPLEARERLRDLWNRAAELGDDLHSLSHRLHSSTLQSLGLASGLSSLCQEFSEQQGIQVDFAHENISRGINPDVALCIFRIVQEALRNVKKHSGANRAEVYVCGEDRQLYLSVSDAGIGFDNRQPSNRAGLGIRSMEERLRLLGGRIDIVSQRNRGTTLNVHLPCKEAQQSVPTNSSAAA
ncbi:MAG: ATP-binding protein [Terriglobales bacterium]